MPAPRKTKAKEAARKVAVDTEVATATQQGTSLEEVSKPRRGRPSKAMLAARAAQEASQNSAPVNSPPVASAQEPEARKPSRRGRKPKALATEQSALPAPVVTETPKVARSSAPEKVESAPQPDVPESNTVTTDNVPQVAQNDAPSEEAPKPRFDGLGLSAPIMQAIEEMGYLHPTPIQAAAIPIVLARRDVLGVAQTGTGKTASFTLPMLEILAGSRARARMPRSLILEPTRELALQVAENFQLYGKHLRINHALLIGGESMADQRAALNQGVDVLIATPGRLIDLFDRGGLLLTQTRILVIDEADRMLDMGFIPDIERIVGLLPPDRQTLFFSATMAPEIRRLADAFLRTPEEITVARAATVAATIEEALIVVDEHDKRRTLRKLLRQENVQNAIVFCNRKRDVDILQKSLQKHRFAAGHLHGDLPQSVRTRTLERFKAGELKILVCSDVAARGIDVSGLSHVFNFDLPFHAEDYVHRIGRTGRAGNKGHAFSLATPFQQNLAEAIETLTKKIIARAEIPGIETLPWADPDAEAPRHHRHGKKGERRHRHEGESDDRNRRETVETNAPAEGRRPARNEQRQGGDRHAPERERIARPDGNTDNAPRARNERHRPQQDERTRETHQSVMPIPAFDTSEPTTGFGSETPAFMLLPRRGRLTGPTADRAGPVRHHDDD